MLHGKNVLLCVTGSIAAYKSALIVRLLVKQGANVKVIMSESAKDFITPLTLGTLSKHPVLTDFAADNEQGVWNNHVDLGIWADVMLVAPATANTLSKMATGNADSFLIATYLSARCPVYVAPAMDLDMYQHGSTKDNLNTLISRGNLIIQSGVGELASGLSGEGRLAEPEEILSFIEQALRKEVPLSGKKVVVSAGPTYEAIDPVRFIGNHSSGKMGYAIAQQAVEMGADVTLVSGPTSLSDVPGTKMIRITSAEEMFGACVHAFEKADVLIMAAAVADYTPVEVASEKIKKKEGDLSIALKRTKDILGHLGSIRNEQQVLVGFAMETQNELENAQSKLVRKNLDFIVLNSLRDKGAGFKADTNKITIIGRNNKMEKFELKSKQEVAKDILDEVVQCL